MRLLKAVSEDFAKLSDEVCRCLYTVLVTELLKAYKRSHRAALSVSYQSKHPTKTLGQWRLEAADTRPDYPTPL